MLGLIAAACDDSASTQTTRPERDASESAVCRLNSDCPPGLYCKDRVCSFDCREQRDCEGDEICSSGRCVPPEVLPEPSPPCGSDDDCGAPSQICEAGDCVAGCLRTGCTGSQTCDAQTGRCQAPVGCSQTGCVGDEVCNSETDRCEPRPFDCRMDGCPGEQLCNNDGRCLDAPPDCRVDGCPADTVCNRANGLCEVVAPDCVRDGCPDGLVCDDFSRQCVEPQPGGMAIGDDCDVSADCDTSLCMGVSLQGVAHNICTSPCCSAADCPPAHACLYNQGAKFCMPSRIFPAGYTFDREWRQDCGPTGNGCRSGMCENRNEGDRCVGGCCTNADCGGFQCVWTATFLGRELKPICDISLGAGGQGAPCNGADLFQCASNVCVGWPAGVESRNGAPGHCADFCCSDNDCPGDFGCGQVLYAEPEGYTNIVSACVLLPRGDTETGAQCATDEACQSGHCVEGVCAEVCCTDNNCLAPQRCLPRHSGELGPRGEPLFIRICTDPPQLP